MRSPSQVGNPTGIGGGVRGVVKGWSLASRRRMRKFLLTHKPKDGRIVYGVTFTIPGPVLPLFRCKELFTSWAHEAERNGYCAVWRAEVQKRGALHWHLIVGAPESKGPEEIKAGWLHALAGLGSVVVPDRGAASRKANRMEDQGVSLMRGCARERDLAGDGPAPGAPPAADGDEEIDVVIFESRTQLPGASQHAVDIAEQGESGKWLRYLQDHATKTKQEQMSESIGRHWGIIGRARWERVKPTKTTDLSGKEYARVLRGAQRLATPRVKDARDPFGRRAGRKITRGRRGETVWFSRPETFERLAQWAKGEV